MELLLVILLALSAQPALSDNTTKAEPPPVTTELPVTVKEGRALNNLTESALDDVTMEEEMSCQEGQTITHGCDEICNCVKGKMECKPMCTPPLLKSIIANEGDDPRCLVRAEDECCSKLICTNDDVTNDEVLSAEHCKHRNQTYEIGDTFYVGCLSTCHCLPNGQVACQARCPKIDTNKSEKGHCLTVPDRKDPCCTILYCDVKGSEDSTFDEETDEEDEISIVSAIPANNTAVIINFDSPSVPYDITAEISEDKISWKGARMVGHIIHDLTPGKTYYIRAFGYNGVTNTVSITLPTLNSTSDMCEYKGKTYKKGLEFYDGCTAYCVCTEQGVECATFKCPTYFGLDVLDPHCLQWETKPADFKPEPPRCCPDTVVCVNNGTCTYKDEMFENWVDIPYKLSGCDMKCYCQAGNVKCSPRRCPPVPATPQMGLQCPPNVVPIVSHPPDDNCCLHWMCPTNSELPQSMNKGHPIHPLQEKNIITVHTLEAVDEHTVRLVFSVPNVLVGLHGRVELRYTADNKNSDPATWEQKVLAPPDDLIATPELEFNLEPLQPDTEYKIKITVVMRDLQNSPASQVLTVRTPPATQPPVIHVDLELHVVDVNSTSATVSWRKFQENELQFIDGVQLRYKEIDGKVYQATPLIHRSVTTYTIEDLKPESQYEIGIFLIPFPGQTTELQAQKTVQLSTTVENDPYKFELILDVHRIKSTSVEVTWSGVPYPEDKYVNIFRAIYQYEDGREDMNTFKVAKRDSPAGTLIQGLKPDTRYRLWIEAYLTSGKIKKSNVKDFITKKGLGSPVSSNEDKLEKASLTESNDYYGPLVGVSILAAIAILFASGLLIILARKHGHNKAPITTAVQRKSLPHTAAYDNPSYKVEMQHETMDL